jgi:serine/threonine protein kinase
MNAIVIGLIIVFLLFILISALAAAIVWASYQPGGIAGTLEQMGLKTAAAPHLLVISSDGRSTKVRLRGDREISIGRDPSNDVVINNHLVSRRHARVFYEQGHWIIEDNSVNGTFQNKRPIARRAALTDNAADTIEIGSARIQLVLPVPAQQPGTHAPAHITGGNARTNGTSYPHRSGTPGAPGQAVSETDRLQSFGRFAVLRTLGEGGMSRVVLGYDPSRSQQLVAIKILHHPDEFLAEKFRQEGGLRLVHQHIVRVLETGEVQDRPYIVMEHVEGVSLRKLLTERPLPLDAALGVMGQLLDALAYAHQHHIIHRDIKPSNIMISPQHGVKIIDFGIAKMLLAATRTQDGLLLGTPQYMSYEQANAQPVTQASDIYSAGIVLYEMLTGKIPFSGEDSMSVVRQHIECNPIPPRRLNAHIPPQIEKAILRALEKDADQRFPSAQAFAQELGCTPPQPLPAAFVQEAAQYMNHDMPGARGQSNRMPPNLVQEITSSRYLRVRSGAHQGQVIQVNGETVLGREVIDMSDKTISRQHFSIEYQNGHCLLRDCSAQGTIVNQRRLKHGEVCNLEHGAIIHVGQTTLIYEERQQ